MFPQLFGRQAVVTAERPEQERPGGGRDADRSGGRDADRSGNAGLPRGLMSADDQIAQLREDIEKALLDGDSVPTSRLDELQMRMDTLLVNTSFFTRGTGLSRPPHRGQTAEDSDSDGDAPISLPPWWLRQRTAADGGSKNFTFGAFGGSLGNAAKHPPATKPESKDQASQSSESASSESPRFLLADLKDENPSGGTDSNADESDREAKDLFIRELLLSSVAVEVKVDAHVDDPFHLSHLFPSRPEAESENPTSAESDTVGAAGSSGAIAATGTDSSQATRDYTGRSGDANTDDDDQVADAGPLPPSALSFFFFFFLLSLIIFSFLICTDEDMSWL